MFYPFCRWRSSPRSYFGVTNIRIPYASFGTSPDDNRYSARRHETCCSRSHIFKWDSIYRKCSRVSLLRQAQLKATFQDHPTIKFNAKESVEMPFSMSCDTVNQSYRCLLLITQGTLPTAQNLDYLREWRTFFTKTLTNRSISNNIDISLIVGAFKEADQFHWYRYYKRHKRYNKVVKTGNWCFVLKWKFFKLCLVTC